MYFERVQPKYAEKWKAIWSQLIRPSRCTMPPAVLTSGGGADVRHFLVAVPQIEAREAAVGSWALRATTYHQRPPRFEGTAPVLAVPDGAYGRADLTSVAALAANACPPGAVLIHKVPRRVRV